MPGIVISSKRKLLIGKRIKEVEVPATTLNTSLFFSDLASLGVNVNATLLNYELGNMPTLVKNECSTALMTGAFREGVIYGFNGDTKSIEVFAFSRNSSATRFNSSGRLEVVGVNVPRIDHDPITKAMRGYLLEPASTNLVLYSGAGNYGTFEALYSSDRPRASFVTESDRTCIRMASGNTFRFSQINFEGGKKYTYSFWIKAVSPTTIRLTNYNGSSYNTTNANIGTQWQQVVKTFEAEVGTKSDLLHIQPLSGNDFPDMFISDIQLEEGEIATSYIPTTNAPAARLADTITSLRPLENFPSATVFIKGAWISSRISPASSMFVTKSNNSRFWFETAGQSSFYVRTYNGSTSIDSQASENAELKLAVSLYPTGFKHCVNGGVVKSATSPFPNEVLPIIIQSGKAILYLRALAIIPRDLSDAEMISITT